MYWLDYTLFTELSIPPRMPSAGLKHCLNGFNQIPFPAIPQNTTKKCIFKSLR